MICVILHAWSPLTPSVAITFLIQRISYIMSIQSFRNQWNLQTKGRCSSPLSWRSRAGLKPHQVTAPYASTILVAKTCLMLLVLSKTVPLNYGPFHVVGESSHLRLSPHLETHFCNKHPLAGASLLWVEVGPWPLIFSRSLDFRKF